MNVEFLEEGAEDCPLIRIYGTNSAEFAALGNLAAQLGSGQTSSYSISDLPGFRVLDGLKLTLVSSTENEGIRRHSIGTDFLWSLAPPAWRIVAGLTEPFVQDSCAGMFQWLTGHEARYGLDVGDISVLLIASQNGVW
jgi:hypothetical protein